MASSSATVLVSRSCHGTSTRHYGWLVRQVTRADNIARARELLVQCDRLLIEFRRGNLPRGIDDCLYGGARLVESDEIEDLNDGPVE
jgi:hypothetical protein